jgi:hypothetical protein
MLHKPILKKKKKKPTRKKKVPQTRSLKSVGRSQEQWGLSEQRVVTWEAGQN